jgi:hypothetical protein
MSVRVRINGYLKDSEAIVNQIKCLGYYEVKLESIHQHKLREFPIDFFGDVLIIVEAGEIDWLNDVGLSRSNFIFYDLASNYFSGQSLGKEDGETTGLMFEPKPILFTVNKLLDAKDVLIKNFNTFVQQEIRERNEIEKLIEFKLLLEETVETSRRTEYLRLY